jgi:hypothetical protein
MQVPGGACSSSGVRSDAFERRRGVNNDLSKPLAAVCLSSIAPSALRPSLSTCWTTQVCHHEPHHQRVGSVSPATLLSSRLTSGSSSRRHIPRHSRAEPSPPPRPQATPHQRLLQPVPAPPLPIRRLIPHTARALHQAQTPPVNPGGQAAAALEAGIPIQTPVSNGQTFIR